MKWLVWISVVAACQRGDSNDSAKPAAKPAPKPGISAEYREDITSLCDVVHLSEADKLPPEERMPSIAMWLGPHIKTPEGHDFLVSIQPLVGEAKAQALEAEARRVGLAGCALAAEWRKPPG
jgi:hypothetical protein